MKIVISDYKDTLESRNLDYEVAFLRRLLPQAEVVIHPFEGEKGLLEVLKDAQGLLTAFVPVGESFLRQCPELRCISVNATGFNAIDVDAAARCGVAVCAVKEYCTQEVADHTMAILLALARRLKAHQHWIDQERRWQYRLVGPVPRLQGKTLAIFGLGRIGQAVAKRAKSFGIKVIAVDPYLPKAVADELEIPLVDKNDVCENAHFITNHMVATKENETLFDAEFFKSLKQSPIFINAARADAVDEKALVDALDHELVSAAGLDVLANVGLDLQTNPLIGRDNVIITPHAAFYSNESLQALQDISCQNLAGYLTGDLSKVNFWVNQKKMNA